MKHITLHPDNARNALLIKDARRTLEKTRLLLRTSRPRGRKPAVISDDVAAAYVAAYSIVKALRSLHPHAARLTSNPHFSRRTRRKGRKVTLTIEDEG